MRCIFRNLENKKQNSTLKRQKTDPTDSLGSSSAVFDQDQEGKDVLLNLDTGLPMWPLEVLQP